MEIKENTVNEYYEKLFNKAFYDLTGGFNVEILHNIGIKKLKI